MSLTFLLDLYGKRFIIDHLAFNHYVMVNDYEDLKSRFNKLGLFEERDIHE
jgi:hypothetical protein